MHPPERRGWSPPATAPSYVRKTYYIRRDLADRLDEEQRRANYVLHGLPKSRLLEALLEAGFERLPEIVDRLRAGSAAQMAAADPGTSPPPPGVDSGPSRWPPSGAPAEAAAAEALVAAEVDDGTGAGAGAGAGAEPGGGMGAGAQAQPGAHAEPGAGAATEAAAGAGAEAAAGAGADAKTEAGQPATSDPAPEPLAGVAAQPPTADPRPGRPEALPVHAAPAAAARRNGRPVPLAHHEEESEFALGASFIKQPQSFGGFRRLLRQAGGRLSQPRPGSPEQRRRDRMERMTRPITGAATIAFMSGKGGVGKTTCCAGGGTALARERGDRAISIDGNPDAGSLGFRVGRQTSATISEVLRDQHQIRRYADIRAYTSQAASRLEVMSAPLDPAVSTALTGDDYRRLHGILTNHYTCLLYDCGTGLLDSATQGILSVADQVVVVTGPSLDAGRVADYSLSWLERRFPQLVRDGIVAVNAVRDDSLVDVQLMVRYFQRHVRAVVVIPYDRYLATGGEIDWERLHSRTRDAYYELAAAIADGFHGPADEGQAEVFDESQTEPVDGDEGWGTEEGPVAEGKQPDDEDGRGDLGDEAGAGAAHQPVAVTSRMVNERNAWVRRARKRRR